MATGKPGFFANIGLPFGMSNANTGNQPVRENARSQLDNKNDNHQVKDGMNNGEANPSNSADPNKGTGTGSQLDGFKNIFTMPTDDKGNVIQQQNPHAEPLLNIDPAKLAEVAGKMDFSAGIAPDLLQKAMSGDAQAMAKVLSTAGQNAFVASTSSMTRVVEDAISRNNQRNDETLSSRVRDVQIKQATVKHPALSHPAAQPMIDALKLQIATTNPTLSPDKVAEHAENYVIALSTDVNTHNSAATEAKKVSTEPDYSLFLPTT